MAGNRALYDLTLKLALNSAELTKGMREANSKISSFQTSVTNQMKLVKNAFMVAAPVIGALAGALKLVKTSMTAVEGSADKLEASISGGKEAFYELQKSIANLDFSNFFKNIEEGFRRGKTYAEQMDSMKLDSAYLDLVLADKRAKLSEARENMTNETNLGLKRAYAAEAVKIQKEITDEIEKQKNKELDIEIRNWAEKNNVTKAGALSMIDSYRIYRELSDKQIQTLRSVGKSYGGGDMIAGIQKYVSFFGQIEGMTLNQAMNAAEILAMDNEQAGALETLFGIYARTKNVITASKNELISLERIQNRMIKGADKDVPENIYHKIAVKPFNLTGLRKSVSKDNISQTTEDLSKQINVVNALSGAFASMFNGIDEGFKGMAQAFAATLKQMAIDLAAKAVVFGILSILSGGAFGVGKLATAAAGLKNNFKWFAGGTSFAPGGLSIVGERGPELVNLPRGSQVFSNSQSKNMLYSKEQLITRLSGKELEIILRRS